MDVVAGGVEVSALRHNCGAEFSREQWDAQPRIVWAAEMGMPSMRPCPACSSHAATESLEPLRADLHTAPKVIIANDGADWTDLLSLDPEGVDALDARDDAARAHALEHQVEP